MNQIKRQINKAKKSGLDMVQLAAIRESARKNSERMIKEYADKALLLNLMITCEILGNDYWERSAKKRIPEFTAKYLGLLDAVQMEIVDWGQIVEDLRDVTGMDFEVEWMKHKGGGIDGNNSI